MDDEGAFLVGVDCGATKILAAAFRRGRKGRLEPLARIKAKTPQAGSPEELVAAIAEAASRAIAEAGAGRGVAGIGVAVPAPLDRARGVVRYAPNLGLEDYPLAARLGKALGLPVRLENDVQAGVYGELKAGALLGRRHAIGVFVGTGVGGGLVIDGELYRGSTGSAGEIGHMILLEGGALCGCGNYGCLEALASRTALAKDALGLAASGKAPALFAAAGVDWRKYKSSSLAASVEGGDAAVARAVARQGFWIGVGLANAVNLLNPEAVVLGGGLVERLGEPLRAAALAAMRERLMPGLRDSVELLLSALGELAVPAGAALMAGAADAAAGDA